MNFNKKTDLFRFNVNQDLRVKNINAESKDKLQKAGEEKLGETTIVKVNVKDIMPAKETENAPKVTSSAPQTNGDNAPWDSETNIMNFIRETLSASGIEPTENLVNGIFKKIVEQVINGNFQDVANIRMVTILIDILMNDENNEDDISDVTKLIDALMNTAPETKAYEATTYGDIKNFILEAAEEINSQIAPDEPVVNPDEPIVINTPEEAIEAILAKFSSAEYDENTTVNDFLLTLQTEASKYIQLKFGYNEGFSDIVAMFIAKAVSDTCGVETGLIKDANLETIKNKFLAQVQNMSFLDTSTNVMTCIRNTSPSQIHYIRATYNENGYVTRGSDWFGDDNRFMTYNPDGTANNGNFLNFLTDYMKNEIYGGNLTEAQLEYVMQKIIQEFGNGYLSDENTINLWAYRAELDKNGNNTFFDEFYSAILKIAEDFRPIDVENAESMDLDELFGDKTVLTAADIHMNENNYLVSNDPGIKAVFAELVNVSNKYNITTDIDYLDFLNVFIRMFNEKCGVPNTDPPTLSRATLENYLKQPNAIQELRDFVMSKELRNAYYMETFVINEEIEDFNQGLSGDCWLLSELIALKQTEAGRKIISDAIDSYVGDDGQTYYTVTFKGGYVNGNVAQVETVVTFSMDEIFDAVGTGYYSKGLDWDTKLLELAVSKIREQHYLSPQHSSSLPDSEGDDYIHGGSAGELTFYLTGYGQVANTTMPTGSETVIVYPLNTHRYVYNEATGKNEIEWYFEHTREEFRDIITESINNGTIQPGTVGENAAYGMAKDGHAYAIIGFTAQGILYTDPYNSDQVKTMTWSEFINSEAKITYIPLDVV